MPPNVEQKKKTAGEPRFKMQCLFFGRGCSGKPTLGKGLEKLSVKEQQENLEMEKG